MAVCLAMTAPRPGSHRSHVESGALVLPRGRTSCGNSHGLFGHEQTEVEPDDSTLWARTRTEDADAFTALFRRHAKPIYDYCFRRLGVGPTSRASSAVISA